MVARYAAAAAMAALVLLLAFAVWGIYQKQERAREAANDKAAELVLLEERREKLEADLAELGTERGREAVLRQNHGVAKAGEEVIIVVPPEADDLEPHVPWYQRLLGWFGAW